MQFPKFDKFFLDERSARLLNLEGKLKYRKIHRFRAKDLPREDSPSGTRIFVDYVLILVAQGHPWNYIEEQWNGAVIKAALKKHWH